MPGKTSALARNHHGRACPGISIVRVRDHAGTAVPIEIAGSSPATAFAGVPISWEYRQTHRCKVAVRGRSCDLRNTSNIGDE
jgi:hypothetical protein